MRGLPIGDVFVSYPLNKHMYIHEGVVFAYDDMNMVILSGDDDDNDDARERAGKAVVAVIQHTTQRGGWDQPLVVVTPSRYTGFNDVDTSFRILGRSMTKEEVDGCLFARDKLSLSESGTTEAHEAFMATETWTLLALSPPPAPLQPYQSPVLQTLYDGLVSMYVRTGDDGGMVSLHDELCVVTVHADHTLIFSFMATSDGRPLSWLSAEGQVDRNDVSLVVLAGYGDEDGPHGRTLVQGVRLHKAGCMSRIPGVNQQFLRHESLDNPIGSMNTLSRIVIDISHPTCGYPEEHTAWCDILHRRRDRMARRIQTYWKHFVTDPSYQVCRRRLCFELTSMTPA